MLYYLKIIEFKMMKGRVPGNTFKQREVAISWKLPGRFRWGRPPLNGCE
jgi:hypothetical protein